MDLRIHFRSLAIRVGEKTFAYDPAARTLGVRYKLKRLEYAKGWIFKNVDPKEWAKFCENPEAASKLAYWFQRGNLLTSTAEITFWAIWKHINTQMPLDLSNMPFQQMPLKKAA